MKQLIFIFIAIATVGFFSCEKENITPPNNNVNNGNTQHTSELFVYATDNIWDSVQYITYTNYDGIDTTIYRNDILPIIGNTGQTINKRIVLDASTSHGQGNITIVSNTSGGLIMIHYLDNGQPIDAQHSPEDGTTNFPATGSWTGQY